MIKKTMKETNTGFMSHNGGLEIKKIDENNYSFSSVIKKFILTQEKLHMEVIYQL